MDKNKYCPECGGLAFHDVNSPTFEIDYLHVDQICSFRWITIEEKFEPRELNK